MSILVWLIDFCILSYYTSTCICMLLSFLFVFSLLFRLLLLVCWYVFPFCHRTLIEFLNTIPSALVIFFRYNINRSSCHNKSKILSWILPLLRLSLSYTAAAAIILDIRELYLIRTILLDFSVTTTGITMNNPMLSNINSKVKLYINGTNSNEFHTEIYCFFFVKNEYIFKMHAWTKNEQRVENWAVKQGATGCCWASKCSICSV